MLDVVASFKYTYCTQAVNNAAYGGSLVTTVHHSTPYVVDTTAPLLEIIMVDAYDTVTNTLTVHYMARYYITSLILYCKPYHIWY